MSAISSPLQNYARTIISEAYEQFNSQITDEDACNFCSTELRDVWAAVRAIDSVQRQRQRGQNMRQVESLLRGFEMYAKIAAGHRDIFEALLSAYSDIGLALPHFRRYDAPFKKNPQVQIALAAIYRIILDFNQRLYRLLRCQGRDCIEREAAGVSDATNAEKWKQQEKDMLLLLEQNEAKLKLAQLQLSIAWLAVDDGRQELEYERISRRRHDETCGWIVQTPEIKAWMNSNGPSPTLCSYIVKHLRTRPEMHTGYYFCNDQANQDICTEVLRTLAMQFLRQDPDLSSLIANEFVYRGVNNSISQMRILLPHILESLSCSTIIIDGLDERPLETQTMILKELQHIGDTQSIPCQIARKLAKRPHIQLDGRCEVGWDIRSYPRHRIRELQSTDQSLLERLETGTVEKSNGMFLWVRLVLDELNYCYSDEELESKLEGLPNGLAKAYRPVLVRMSDKSCSFRPLKVHEVLEGLVLRPSYTILNKRTKISRAVLDFCRPLIEEGSAGTLEFIHFSAKEYVLREEFQDGHPFVMVSKAHRDIAFACICHLNSAFSLIPGRCPREDQIEAVIDGFHGLFHYASQFWYMHLLEYCKEEANQTAQLLDGMRNQLEKLLIFRKRHIREKFLQASQSRMETKLVTADPTYFSAIQKNYQEIVEGVIEGDLPASLLLSKANELASFRKVYGPSAFVCRYVHCSRATDGFVTARQRDSHEEHHERKFRCAIVTCAFFAAGFATRGALKKHNDKYHSSPHNVTYGLQSTQD
ncbi:hypothetical protein BKA61DRAFT_629792 [Leptodontidium sp. MPI-SDFR-AT-0119]|nr:hypothetical protein BKA61DRAFT_629792 [Leptodontidium sp. MPI-SDFR-AT-0119]